MTKKLVRREAELYGDEKLSDLIKKYGDDSSIMINYSYDDTTVYVVYEELETDDEYKQRKEYEKYQREMQLKEAQRKVERKKKAAEDEYKRYLELKEKYEQS